MDCCGTKNQKTARAIEGRGENKMKSTNSESINPAQAGNALAITATGLYVACGLLLLVLPKTTVIAVYNSIFHGIDLSNAVGGSKSIGTILTGVVIIAILSWIGGVFFAKVYNRLTSADTE